MTEQNGAAFRDTFDEFSLSMADPWTVYAMLIAAFALRTMVKARIGAGGLDGDQAALMLSHVEVFIATLAEHGPRECRI